MLLIYKTIFVFFYDIQMAICGINWLKDYKMTPAAVQNKEKFTVGCRKPAKCGKLIDQNGLNGRLK